MLWICTLTTAGSSPLHTSTFWKLGLGECPSLLMHGLLLASNQGTQKQASDRSAAIADFD
jgi:hypothetical protein